MLCLWISVMFNVSVLANVYNHCNQTKLKMVLERIPRMTSLKMPIN